MLRKNCTLIFTTLLLCACAESDVQSSAQSASGSASQSVVETFKMETAQNGDCPTPQIWIGEKPDMITLDKIRDETPWTYRVYQKSDMITMDYVATRINLVTDESGIVTDIHCG